MLTTIGAALGVIVSVLVILGIAWRWVVLPNLREQLRPIEEASHATRKAVSENKHRNRPPTLLDRIDDVENMLDMIGLNQQAIMRQLGRHIGESTQDRANLWLIIDSIARSEYDQQLEERQDDESKRGNTGGA